jgi:hypothetical protein
MQNRNGEKSTNPGLYGAIIGASLGGVYSDRNERSFQYEVEHQFRRYSNTDSGAARTVA